MAKFLLFLLGALLPAFVLANNNDLALRQMSILNRLMQRRDWEDQWIGGFGNVGGKGAPSGCVQDEYFDQKLDHFNASDNGTFKQRFQANFHYRDNATNGPSPPIVFLMIGGEAQINAKWVCDERVGIMQIAKEHAAVVVQLEHRFFGQNASAGLGDLSTENMQRHLTMDQALADIASFVPFFNEHFGLKNAKWVAFGGSYPGSMAAWLRVKYPELTVGSVASSAPIWPKVDFWEYSARMEEAINKTSQQCHQTIKNAFHQLVQMTRDDRGKLELDKLYTANPSFKDLDQIDITNFFSAVFGAWQGIIQYTYDEPVHNFDNLTLACNILTKAKDPQQGLFDVFWRVKRVWCDSMGAKPEECIPNNFKYEDAIKPLRDLSIEGDEAGSRAWMWMTCNEFGWYQTTDKDNSIFGDIISMNFFYRQCSDLFGEQIGAAYVDEAIANSLTKWGNGCTFEATNVILPNGRFDPWSMLGIREDCRNQKRQEQDAKQHLISVWTEGAAHCADMYPAYESEPRGLELTRQKVREQVNFYLAKGSGGGGGGNGASTLNVGIGLGMMFLLAIISQFHINYLMFGQI